MNSTSRLYCCIAAALVFVLSSAGIAAAQPGTDTCVGVFAGNAGSCTPLENSVSGSNQNTAVGDQSLTGTTGTYNSGSGFAALYENSGSYNTADGEAALSNNTG